MSTKTIDINKKLSKILQCTKDVVKQLYNDLENGGDCSNDLKNILEIKKALQLFYIGESFKVIEIRR